MIGWVALVIGIALFVVGFSIRYADVGGAEVKLGFIEIKATSAAAGTLFVGLAVMVLGVWVLTHPGKQKPQLPRLAECQTKTLAGKTSNASNSRDTQVAYILAQREHPFFLADVIVTIISVKNTAEGAEVTAQIRDAPQTRAPVVLRHANIGSGYRRFVGRFDVAINCIDSHGARVTVARVA